MQRIYLGIVFLTVAGLGFGSLVALNRLIGQWEIVSVGGLWHGSPLWLKGDGFHRAEDERDERARRSLGADAWSLQHCEITQYRDFLYHRPDGPARLAGAATIQNLKQVGYNGWQELIIRPISAPSASVSEYKNAISQTHTGRSALPHRCQCGGPAERSEWRICRSTI